MPEAEIPFEHLRDIAAGDDLLEELCDDTINCSRRYFESVLAFERVADIQKFRMPKDDYLARLGQLDQNRRLIHNALCDKLRILARASAKAGLDASWYRDIAGPNEDRYAVGDWALKTVFEELYVKGDTSHE